MQKIFQIAIDGPSGAGKSTIAKRVAEELAIDYIDTGAMYRAVGLKMLRLGIPMEENETLFEMLRNTDVDFSEGRVYLDGEDVSDVIRTQEVSKAASDCSAFATVRRKLVELQQAMGKRKSVIMDGRDIGTAILPDAELKIYLTASVEERARRRYLEMTQKGEACSLEEIQKDIADRDWRDMHRETAPLRQAEDAVYLDTSDMTLDEVVAQITRLAEERM